ncbi:MAG: TonB-dependent receptor, partial [Flavobacteriales bacterium]|nr:TonB-dependent receptor [Flavobacteriales bacterium]
ATLRRDGSSRFAPENRWGLFPSAAVAWRVTEESFMENVEALSYLKFRAGFGITGQQDIGNDYPYLANYQTSTPTAYYQLGNEFYSLLRPDGFDFNIKWEETASTNIGIDYGFSNDRVYGSIDYYIKNTKDLLAVVDVPAGANFKNEILTNVGSMTNKGLEAELNFVAISKKETELIIGANVTMNRNEITQLTKVADTSSVGILVGGISGGIGNNIQIQAVGHPTNSFYVYEQVYDAEGNPVEGEFVDRNDDGLINEKDRYIFQKPAPDAFVGFYTNFRHKKWTAGFNMRAELGRYMYNNVISERGWFNGIPAENHIFNLHSAFYDTEFISSSPEQFLSDYYLEKANFVRMDYLSVGYNVGPVLKDRAVLNVGAVVNNVFVISGYRGIDPEIANGIDQNIYPRPRIFSLNLNLTI